MKSQLWTVSHRSGFPQLCAGLLLIACWVHCIHGELRCRSCTGVHCKSDQGTGECTIPTRFRNGSTHVIFKCITSLFNYNVDTKKFDEVRYWCPVLPFEAEECTKTYSTFIRTNHIDLCCDDGHLCNGNFDLTNVTLPTPPPSTTTPPPLRVTAARAPWELPVAVSLPSVIGVVFLVTLICFVANWRKDRAAQRSSRTFDDDDEDPYFGGEGTDTTLESSLTGDQRTRMAQVTIAKQITLERCIGKGRYGEVYHGRWRGGQDVAVKIFAACHDRSYMHEVGIYETTWLRHENILGFVAADNRDDGMSTHLWMVTDYCPYGSLHDYITNPKVVITVEKALKLMMTAGRGLAHLHTTVTGAANSKPAMAHRDIKSRNFLVRRDGSACVADLGLAIRETDQNMPWNTPKSPTSSATQGLKTDGSSKDNGAPSQGTPRPSNGIAPNANGFSTPTPFNYRVGTRRYLAPEILDESMRVEKFDSFRCTDVYSFALVMWEICQRIAQDGMPPAEYEQPYQGMVSSDPDLEEMKQVVVAQQCRPKIPDWWGSHRYLSRLSSHMEESWCHNCQARSTMARLKKKLELVSNEAQAARRESRESAQAVPLGLQDIPAQIKE